MKHNSIFSHTEISPEGSGFRALSDDELGAVYGGVSFGEADEEDFLEELDILTGDAEALEEKRKELWSAATGSGQGAPTEFDGIEMTADALKTLKEKIMPSTTDTSTEVDRAAIQKVMDQEYAQIDDSAIVTFHGKPFSDGER